MGRTLFPPFGWFDERAKKEASFMPIGNVHSRTQIQRGTVILRYHYDDTDKLDPMMIYLPPEADSKDEFHRYPGPFGGHNL